MFFNINQYSFDDFRKEIRLIFALALPMMSAQIASVAIGVVDTAMAGAAGTDDLTAVALGSSVFITVFITFIGVMTALNPMIAQLNGAKKMAAIGETGRQGLWFGLIIGLIGAALLIALIVPLQNYLNLDSRIEHMFALYLFFTALGMPAAMLYRALHAYASSLNRPKPIMWISWAALLLNIPLNYLFIFGGLGIPRMGGAGAGVATALVWWFSTVCLWVYIVRQPYFEPFGLTERFSRPDTDALKQMWKLGWPIGLSYFLEASLFTFIVWLIADLGSRYVAAQQVVLSLSSLVYMIPQAVGAATTVRIGYAIGKRQFVRARYISGTALLCGGILALCTCAFLMVFRKPLVALYTDDAAIIGIAASVLVFTAVFQVFDFTQCIASYALRGYKLTRVPMMIHAVAFWVLGLLPGYILAYRFEMGIYGFWTALVLSLATAAVVLVWYLDKCSKWAQRHRAL